MTPAAKNSQHPECSVLLVEDHPLVRDGLAAQLQAMPMIRVVGSVGSVAEGKVELAASSPDVLLVDHKLRDGTGIDLVAEARRRYPEMKVVVLSAYSDGRLVDEYTRQGVLGYVNKLQPGVEIRRVILSAVTGSLALCPESNMELVKYLRDGSARPTGGLSGRERQILSLVSAGKRNQEIADELFLSLDTVKTYLKRACRKTGSRTRGEAAAKAIRSGALT